MSVFYEQEEYRKKEKEFQIQNRTRNPKHITRLRYNNGRSKSNGTAAMVVTIPASIVREFNLHSGDRIKVIPVKENNTIIIKPFIGETIK